MSSSKPLWLAIGALGSALLYAGLRGAGLPDPAARAAAIGALCAIYWMSEALPLAATSLLPLALFPLCGILTSAGAAKGYSHPLVLLLMGGFLLSRGLEVSGAHRQVALRIVRAVGSSPRRLVVGFMLACALCSMWISNTATVLMLLPVAEASFGGVSKDLSEKERTAFAHALFLGIAYSASIGGMGTPVGTPPNSVLIGILSQKLGIEMGFLEWMTIALPMVAGLLPITALVLLRRLPKQTAATDAQIADPGPWTRAQKRVLALFACVALGWITRKAPFGGWSGLLHLKGVNDSAVAALGAAALFALPSGEGGPIIRWKEAVKVPWGLLLLFGGGITLAAGFGASGLSTTIGKKLSVLGSAPLWIATLVVALSVTFATEMTSNTATTTLLMPILASAAVAAGIAPTKLMVPAAISASCAFMLPVATAPNAVVFGTGRVPIRKMARTGLVLNLLGAVWITLISLWRL